MPHYQHVLVPVDFTETDAQSLAQAKDLMDKYQTKLTVLHVMQDVPVHTEPFANMEALPLSPELRDQQTTNTQEKLGLLISQAGLPDSTAIACTTGVVADAIVRFAVEQSVDLMVITHSGRRGFLGFMGTTADALVKSAQCDVLVVRNGTD